MNVALAVWLLLEPHIIRSWGNSDSGLSHSPTEMGRPWVALAWH